MRLLAALPVLLTLLLAGSALAAFGGSAPTGVSAGTDTSTTVSAGAAADAGAPSAPLTTTMRARMFAAMQVMADAQLRPIAGATIRERVLARLRDRTLTVANSLPEECRPMEGEDRTECRRRYAAIQACYDQDDAVPCLKTKLAIKATVKATLADCEDKTGDERSDCVADIRENVFSLVKARFYAAEERAEKFVEKWSLDEALLASFIADMEQAKIDFNAAADIPAKKAVLKEARARWHAFVREAVKAKLAAQASAGASAEGA